MGRPSRFHPHLIGKIERLLLLGLSDVQLMEQIGINSPQTLGNWRRKHPKLNAVFERSRSLAHGNVAKSLFKRANGFRVKSEKVFQHNGEIVRAKTTEYYPPDVRAAEIILRARAPEQWPSDRGVQVGIQVVAGLPNDTLEGLQRLARMGSGLSPTIESAPINKNLPTGQDGGKNEAPNAS